MEETERKTFEVRTDLAMEERESFPGDGGEISGVELRECEKKDSGIRLTEVVIKNEQGARSMRKPVGTYLTLEAPLLFKQDSHEETSKELARQIRLLFSRRGFRLDQEKAVGAGGGAWEPGGDAGFPGAAGIGASSDDAPSLHRIRRGFF